MLDLVFPRRCPVCDQPVRPFGALICRECEAGLEEKKLSSGKDALCCRCGKPLADPLREFCHDCGTRKHWFQRGCAVYRYHDISGTLYRFKYGARREYAAFLGLEMAERLRQEFGENRIDLLIPVPVSRERYRKRGYNQAGLLAREISKRTGIPVREDILLRQSGTQPLRNISADGRRRNLKNAFIVSDIDVKSKLIMLVDDIFTTGATMDACARELLRAGAAGAVFVVSAIGEDRI